MTFWEAFNTGKKFRLPQGYTADSSWPKGWYWQKRSQGEIYIGSSGWIKSVDDCLYENSPGYDVNILALQRLSEDFYLLEDDEA